MMNNILITEILLLFIIDRYAESYPTPFHACATGSSITVLFESDHSYSNSGFLAVFYINGK